MTMGLCRCIYKLTVCTQGVNSGLTFTKQFPSPNRLVEPMNLQRLRLHIRPAYHQVRQSSSVDRAEAHKSPNSI